MQRIPNKSTDHEMDQCRNYRKKEAPIGWLCGLRVCVCLGCYFLLCRFAARRSTSLACFSTSTARVRRSISSTRSRRASSRSAKSCKQKEGMRSKSKMPALRSSSDLTQCKDLTLQQVKAFDGQVQALLVLNKLQTEAGVLRCVTHGNWGQRGASAQ
jgi:hypothetical protein